MQTGAFYGKNRKIGMGENHCGVLAQSAESEWYILDGAKPGPINISKNRKALKAWMRNVLFLNIYQLKVDNYPHKEMEARVKEWYKVLDGTIKDYNDREEKPRPSLRKSDKKVNRVKRAPQGDKTFRKNKPRKTSGRKRRS